MEAIFKRLFTRAGKADSIRIESAGIQGTGGVPRSEHDALAEYPEGAIMIPMLKDAGLDISAHRYRPVCRKLMEEAAVVMVPSEDIRSGQPNALRNQFPEFSNKIMLLRELVSEQIDIPDFGGSFDAAVHRTSLDLMLEYAERGYGQLSVLLRI